MTIESDPAASRSIGRPLRRREDERLVTGRAVFADDAAEPGDLTIAFLRSPVAAARIVRLDVAAARAMPGVHAVLTAADTALIGAPPVNRIVEPLHLPAFEALARERLRALGQPVAAVVARGLTAARDAVEAILLEVEETEASAEPAFAIAWKAGPVARAFATARTVIAVETQHALIAPSALEPRAIRVAPDGQGLVIHHATQTPHRTRSDVAELFRLDPAAVRVIARDVGGAFGGKASLTAEELVVIHAALALRRPVGWTATRGEELLAAPRGRGMHVAGRLALDARGRPRAIEARIAAPLGWFLPFSAAIPARNAGRIIPGPYRIDVIDVAAAATVTGAPPIGIYRGAGRPEAAMLIERLIERAARTTGRDPIAYRKALVHRRFPARTAAGETIDSGDFTGLLDRLAAVARHQATRAEVRRRRRRGELVGSGIALAIEPCGQGFESARIARGAGNRITVATGSTSQGQGRETAVAQIVADELGIDIASIDVEHGDTATTPQGIGALASRSTPIGGSALIEAARRFKASGQTAEVRHEVAREAWASGAAAALVAIDRDTGAVRIERLAFVDDAGRIINPLLVEGQLHGAIAQAVGEALFERIVEDGSGQLLTGSLMDYALPRARDVPPLALSSLHTPTTANLIGAKGVGEAGTVATPAAILNAVEDALDGYDVGELALPVTSQHIWRILSRGPTAGRGA